MNLLLFERMANQHQQPTSKWFKYEKSNLQPNENSVARPHLLCVRSDNNLIIIKKKDPKYPKNIKTMATPNDKRKTHFKFIVLFLQPHVFEIITRPTPKKLVENITSACVAHHYHIFSLFSRQKVRHRRTEAIANCDSVYYPFFFPYHYCLLL